MTRPEAVVVSASSVLTTIRSSRGLMETDTADLPFACELFMRSRCAFGPPSSRVPGPCSAVGTLQGRVPAPHSRNALALGQGECQRPTANTARDGPLVRG